MERPHNKRGRLDKTTVAFVCCVHNSCAIKTKKKIGGKGGKGEWAKKTRSAFLKCYLCRDRKLSGKLKPLAVEVMEEAGVDMSGQ